MSRVVGRKDADLGEPEWRPHVRGTTKSASSPERHNAAEYAWLHAKLTDLHTVSIQFLRNPIGLSLISRLGCGLMSGDKYRLHA